MCVPIGGQINSQEEADIINASHDGLEMYQKLGIMAGMKLNFMQANT